MVCAMVGPTDELTYGVASPFLYCVNPLDVTLKPLHFTEPARTHPQPTKLLDSNQKIMHNGRIRPDRREPCSGSDLGPSGMEQSAPYGKCLPTKHGTQWHDADRDSSHSVEPDVSVS